MNIRERILARRCVASFDGRGEIRVSAWLQMRLSSCNYRKRVCGGAGENLMQSRDRSTSENEFWLGDAVRTSTGVEKFAFPRGGRCACHLVIMAGGCVVTRVRLSCNLEKDEHSRTPEAVQADLYN